MKTISLTEMTLGQAIRTLRMRKGLQQQELAVACKITPAYLSQIENDKRKPNWATIERISGVLETPITILMFLAMSDILMFLEMSELDIPEHKREGFRVLYPAMKAFVTEFFITE